MPSGLVSDLRGGHAADRLYHRVGLRKAHPPASGLARRSANGGPGARPPLGDIDQSPAFDLTDPAPVPEDEFDQTVLC